MMGNPTATAEFVTLVVVGVFTLGSAYWLGQVSKPYQPEFEVEKMYRKFHTFSTFWGAVGKQQSPQKERWVGTLCLVAGVFDPPFLEGGQAKKAPAPGPAEEAPLGNEDDTFSGVAAELARAAEAQEEEEEMVVGDDADKEGKAALGAGRGKDVQDGLAMLEVQATHSQAVLGSRLRRRGNRCWQSLKDKVMNERDLRSYRMMVKRSFKTLACMMLLTGITLFLYGAHSFFGSKAASECKQGNIDVLTAGVGRDELPVDHTCMNDRNGFQVCRVQCKAPRLKRERQTGFYMCFMDKSTNFAEWVPLVECPLE